MLYNSLILPTINYDILSWGATKGTHMNRLIVMHKKASRLCTGHHNRFHHEAICKSFHLLKLKDIYTLRAFKLILAWHKNKLPSPIHSMFKLTSAIGNRSHRFQNNFYITKTRLKTSSNHISVRAAMLWNDMPSHLKVTNLAITTMSQKLKNCILKNYSYECPSINHYCYICNQQSVTQSSTASSSSPFISPSTDQ